MNEEQTKLYKDMVERINNMTLEQWDELIDKDQCPFEPEHLLGVPIGMFHCMVCGEMVVAGLSHPRKGNDGGGDQLHPGLHGAEPEH